MEEKEHNLKMENRSFIEVTGILEADSSEEKEINLKTTMGELIIQGENLQIRHLDLNAGMAVVKGKISAIVYPIKDMRAKRPRKESMFNRFFKG